MAAVADVLADEDASLMMPLHPLKRRLLSTTIEKFREPYLHDFHLGCGLGRSWQKSVYQEQSLHILKRKITNLKKPMHMLSLGIITIMKILLAGFFSGRSGRCFRR